MEHRMRLRCRRLILTHMNEELLARRGDVEVEYAEDGQSIIL